MVSVSVRLTHIHAERLMDRAPGALRVNVQITVPGGEPQVGERVMRVPFSFNMSTTPLAFTVTLRGYVEVEADKERIAKLRESLGKGTPPPEIMNAVTSFTMFEALLLARELGFPPLLPLPSPPFKGQTGQSPIGPV